MELMVSQNIFWSGSVNNYRMSCDHSEVYSGNFITLELRIFTKAFTKNGFKFWPGKSKDGSISFLNGY